ncbi:MAG: amino acid ABC transporter ATP-binding protein [Gemmatimonadetes bacterium]|nr:amino acid ABC transporter ATP-binding protein [Gemmatimonadota bacterium]
MADLAVRGLVVERAGRQMVRGVDLDVARGEVCVLMGESGAGKTTILRVVAALEPFAAGIVTAGEARLAPGPLPPQSQLRALRSTVGMVFQSHALFEHLSATDNVTLATTHVLGWEPSRSAARAAELLEQLGVAHRADARPGQLSGGEAQRVAIARALAPDPMLLLMDEPTAALDPARRTALATTVRDLAGAGRAVLISTHDEEFARAAADRVVRLVNGVIA